MLAETSCPEQLALRHKTVPISSTCDLKMNCSFSVLTCNNRTTSGFTLKVNKALRGGPQEPTSYSVSQSLTCPHLTGLLETPRMRAGIPELGKTYAAARRRRGVTTGPPGSQRPSSERRGGASSVRKRTEGAFRQDGARGARCGRCRGFPARRGSAGKEGYRQEEQGPSWTDP